MTGTFSSPNCTQFMFFFCLLSSSVLVVRGVSWGKVFITDVLGFKMAVSFINVFNYFVKETSKVP